MDTATLGNPSPGEADRRGASISDDTVHAVVQRLGRQANAALLPPFPAMTAKEFYLVIMMGGWCADVDQIGAGPRKTVAERVEWKEVESAVIYWLETRTQNASGRGLLVEKHVVATPPESSRLDFGATVHAAAPRCGLAQAKMSTW